MQLLRLYKVAAVHNPKESLVVLCSRLQANGTTRRPPSFATTPCSRAASLARKAALCCSWFLLLVGRLAVQHGIESYFPALCRTVRKALHRSSASLSATLTALPSSSPCASASTTRRRQRLGCCAGLRSAALRCSPPCVELSRSRASTPWLLVFATRIAPAAQYRVDHIDHS